MAIAKIRDLNKLNLTEESFRIHGIMVAVCDLLNMPQSNGFYFTAVMRDSILDYINISFTSFEKNRLELFQKELRQLNKMGNF